MDPNEMSYIDLYNSIDQDTTRYTTFAKESALEKLKDSFLELFGYEMQTEPDPS